MPSNIVSARIRNILLSLEDGADNYGSNLDYWKNPRNVVKPLIEILSKQINQYESLLNDLPDNSVYCRHFLAKIANEISKNDNMSIDDVMLLYPKFIRTNNKYTFPKGVSFRDGFNIIIAEITDELLDKERAISPFKFRNSIAKLNINLAIDYLLKYIVLLESTISGWMPDEDEKASSRLLKDEITTIGAFVRQLSKTQVSIAQYDHIKKIADRYQRLSLTDLFSGSLWTHVLPYGEYSGDIFGTLYSEIDNLISQIAEYLSVELGYLNNSSSYDKTGDLSHLIPDQELGPLQFENDGYRLIVRHQHDRPAGSDEDIAKSVQRGLMRQGQRILSALEGSQCDRRFLEAARELHELVEAQEDIILLGMEAQSCQVRAKQYHDEFSNDLVGQLTAYFQAINDYVGQFPQWQRYLENAVGAKMLQEEHVEALRIVVRRVTDFAKTSDVVAPDIADKLELIGRFIEPDQPVKKRNVAANASTMRNILAASATFWADIGKVAAEEGAKFVVKKGMMLALQSLVGLFVDFAPISDMLDDQPWMSDVIDVIKDGKDALGDDVES